MEEKKNLDSDLECCYIINLGALKSGDFYKFLQIIYSWGFALWFVLDCFICSPLIIKFLRVMSGIFWFSVADWQLLVGNYSFENMAPIAWRVSWCFSNGAKSWGVHQKRIWVKCACDLVSVIIWRCTKLSNDASLKECYLLECLNWCHMLN